MELLPDELLLYIFRLPAITFVQLYRLMLTCKRFYNIIEGTNELWKSKYIERWMHLQYVDNVNDTVWKDEVHTRLLLCRKIHFLLHQLSSHCYPDQQLPFQLLHAFKQEINSSKLFHYASDELVDIVFHQNQDENLSFHFYGHQVLKILRIKKIKNDWELLSKLPESEMLLIKGAVIIAQWGQVGEEHWVSLTEIENQLDNLESRIREVINLRYGSHALDVPLPLDPDYSNKVRAIMSCVNQVLFKEFGLKGNREDYSNYMNSYINKVLELKKGIPITLSVIYHTIASKFGIVCEPVCFPRHFLLRWQEFANSYGGNQYTFIDAFNEGNLLLPVHCPALIGQQSVESHYFSEAKPMEVFERMAMNLASTAMSKSEYGNGDLSALKDVAHFYRLNLLISPLQPRLALEYANICLHLGTNVDDAIDVLQSLDVISQRVNLTARISITIQKCHEKLEQLDRRKEIQPVHRPINTSDSVIYGVGMIMRHLHYNYRCVIVGWDPNCTASADWMEAMQVHRLVRGVTQPFYHVLVEDGSTRYAAEENLVPSVTGTSIPHEELGRHFERFDGIRYIPNKEKRIHYPDDEKVVLSILSSRKEVVK